MFALTQSWPLRWHYALTLLLLLAAAVLNIAALAYPLNPNRILETFFCYVILHRLWPRGLRAVLWLSALLVLCYHPTASLYGRPSYGIVASLLSTNRQEAWEYVHTVPVGVYAAALLLALANVLLAHWLKQGRPPVFRRRWLLPLCLFVGLAAADTGRKSYAAGGFPLRVMPVEFLADAYLMPKAYFDELARLKQAVQQAADWQIEAVTQPYQTYVLVIGESMRSDYMSLYGFGIDNTPFLRRHAHVVMENMMSPGPNTPISLLHGLSLQQGDEVQLHNNLISLAQAAGMHTSWLSNQGALGKYDTSVAAIGQRADHHQFLKPAGYDFGRPSHDEALLPLFAAALRQPVAPGQKRLIVLHLIGSHPDPCQRLKTAPQQHTGHRHRDCYIDSIAATDALLAQLHQLLQQSVGSHSLLYFSDHGLSHEHGGSLSGDYSLRHNDRYRQNYHVPLVVINSDGQSLQRNPALRSGERLLSGLSQWLGIRSRELNGSDFFAATDDTTVRMLNLGRQWQNISDLADDPVPVLGSKP